jgi:hypothetical protein
MDYRDRRSAEGRDDMLGKQLDLTHFLVPGHKALIEELAEPLEVTLAAEDFQLFDLSFDLIDRAG